MCRAHSIHKVILKRLGTTSVAIEEASKEVIMTDLNIWEDEAGLNEPVLLSKARENALRPVSDGEFKFSS